MNLISTFEELWGAGNRVSGAAKVDFSPESCILLRKHDTLHKCSLVPIDHLKK